jgi:hypothetical protein
MTVRRLLPLVAMALALAGCSADAITAPTATPRAPVHGDNGSGMMGGGGDIMASGSGMMGGGG